MINTIKNYFEELFQNKSEESKQNHTIELACAALMIEISLADDHIDSNERQVINKLLSDSFNLTDNEIEQLISLAESEVDHAVSLHGFTSLLNNSLTMPEKIRIIENLWHVAFADSVLDKYEEYYIRKVADLLYISHSDYIQAKLKAEK
jgi:uncharacterized tellurite resistance protein B-like protein